MGALERSKLCWGICGGAALAACLLCTGCAGVPMHERSAGEVAAALEQRHCGGNADEAALAPVLSGAAVETWERAYSSVPAHGGEGTHRRLAGAAFTVRAVKGYSAEWLDRALTCHSARRALGRLPPEGEAQDPFSLPGKTVDIRVESTGEGFLVEARSPDVAEASEIVARARAFTSGARAMVCAR